MTALFELFLNIGARNFLPRYRELKAAGQINSASVAYYLVRFAIYSFMALCVAAVVMWVMGGIVFAQGSGFSVNFDISIPMVFGLFIALYIWWTLIEMVGDMVHVYSRGRVAKARVLGTKSRMGRGFYVLLTFEVDGKSIETSFAKQVGQKSYWEGFPHEYLEIIYAEDNPEMVMPFKEATFASRCLDSSRKTAPRD